MKCDLSFFHLLLNRNNYYLSSGLYASSKYSYVTPIIDNNTIIEKEYFADLQKNPPVLFIYQQDNGCEKRINDLIKSFLHDNDSLLDVDFAYLYNGINLKRWLGKLAKSMLKFDVKNVVKLLSILY